MSRTANNLPKNKECVYIISQNTRGLKSDTKIQELGTKIKSRNIFPACFQETWRTGVSTFEHENCIIFSNGLDPNLVKGRHVKQGVGILLSKNAVTAWKSTGFIVHNDLGARIIAVRLLVNDNMKNEVGLFLISAYAPIGNANQKLWDNFIEKLEICISRKHPSDILVIGCDTNSSIGTSNKRSNYGSMRSIGPFGLTHRNRAAVRFNTNLEVNNLVAVTTHHKKNNYTIWTHPRSKLPHQIDHIITRTKMTFSDLSMLEQQHL